MCTDASLNTMLIIFYDLLFVQISYSSQTQQPEGTSHNKASRRAALPQPTFSCLAKSIVGKHTSFSWKSSFKELSQWGIQTEDIIYFLPLYHEQC